MMLPIARSTAVLILLAIACSPALGAKDGPVTDPAKLEQALTICTGDTKTLEQNKRAKAACSQVIDSPAAEDDARFTALMTRGIMDRHDWQAQALSDFTDAVALQPDSAVAHYWRGVMLNWVTSKEDPLDSFDKAVALDPEFVDAHLARAQSLAGKGRQDEALKSYNRAVELAPKNAWPLVGRARFLAGNGNSEAALTDLDKALGLEPGNISALNERGEIYLEKGRDDLALADFEKAVAIASETGRSVGGAEKNKAMLLYRRARAFHDTGEFEQAVQDYSAVMEIMDYSDELDRRGEAYYALGKYKEALADFDTSIARTERRREKLKQEASSGGRGATRAQQLLARIAPSKEAVEGRRKALCQLEGGKDCDAADDAKKRDAEANALLQQLIATCTGKDPAKAVDGCTQIIDSTTIKLTKEDRATVFYRRGLAHLNQDKLRPAFLDFTAALDGSSNPQVVLIDRARVFIRAKDYNEAIKDLTTALELSPSSGTAYYYRAMAYAGSDQIARSVKDFNNALHHLKATFKGKTSAEAHLKKGKEHRKAKKFGSASIDFLRAAYLAETGSPLQIEALDLLGRSYWAGARDELAVMAMSTFLALRPNDAPGYNMRGMSFNELGKSELAIADYNKAMSLDPTQYVWAYFNNRGRAYATMGKFELAVKDYDEALRLKPDYPAAQRNKAEAEAALSKEN
ncbi:MAG: tetratricopeptide repeat protein [Alphaproteobacteria bacterium]|nr:tetratricopeptide repeat protein [Alphaproteobacteria bacterium]